MEKGEIGGNKLLIGRIRGGRKIIRASANRSVSLECIRVVTCCNCDIVDEKKLVTKPYSV